MNPLLLVRDALKSLRRNTFRAFLTMLGIIIGVGAVIAMIALGRGAQAEVADRVSQMGTDVLWVRAGSRSSRGIAGGAGSVNTLTVEDFDAILRECPSVAAVSPSASTSRQVVFENRNWNTRIEGYNELFPELRNWAVDWGTMFDDRHVKRASRVAVIGRTIQKELFPGSDPVGQTIRIGNLPFKVLGVLAAKGAGPRGDDQDDAIVVPYTTVQKKFMSGTLNVQSGVVKAVDGRASYAEEEIAAVLRQRHNIRSDREDDFQIHNFAEFAEMLEATQSVMTALLAGIAAVSLIVGGIGIMNIMLVSVSERTREVGIHMSIGARPSHIRGQFLLEAIVLCVLGGFLGLVLGVGSSLVMSEVLGWATEVTADAVAVAILFPAAIGVFFGYYPAHKAAGLDPIEALRWE